MNSVAHKYHFLRKSVYNAISSLQTSALRGTMKVIETKSANGQPLVIIQVERITNG